MPAACRSSSRAELAPHRGQLRPAGDQPRDLAAGGARDRRAFDRDVQRHVVVPLRRIAARSSACSGTPIVGGPRRCARSRARNATTASSLRASHDGYADRFGVVHQRALTLARRRHAARRRGPVRRRRRRQLPRAARDQFAVRFHLHPVGQGQPPHRRPRRHADAAEQGGVDLHRLRGSRRARGERLSRRPRRPAPHACRS